MQTRFELDVDIHALGIDQPGNGAVEDVVGRMPTGPNGRAHAVRVMFVTRLEAAPSTIPATARPLTYDHAA